MCSLSRKQHHGVTGAGYKRGLDNWGVWPIGWGWTFDNGFTPEGTPNSPQKSGNKQRGSVGGRGVLPVKGVLRAPRCMPIR